MLSTFLALALRLIPFVICGIVGAVLFQKGSILPEFVWSRLILKFAPPGLLGLVIAAELAGYMAIASAYKNWGASFLANDVGITTFSSGQPLTAFMGPIGPTWAGTPTRT